MEVKNLEGLSEDDGFKQPSPGGNCLNWVAGLTHA